MFISIYNLIEHSSNSFDTTGSLWISSGDETSDNLTEHSSNYFDTTGSLWISSGDETSDFSV